jgi:LPS export ABC transporter protein LptC
MVSKSSLLMGTVLSAMVALTSWLALHSENTAPAVPSSLPTGYAHHINVQQMTAQGVLYYQLNAQAASQHGDDWVNLKKPSGKLYDQAQAAPWQFSANYGKVLNQHDKIILTGNVIFNRIASIAGPALKFNTEYLTINTVDKTAATPYPVKFTQPGTGNVTTAVGMNASFNAKVLNLLSKVDSYYEPIKVSS